MTKAGERRSAWAAAALLLAAACSNSAAPVQAGVAVSVAPATATIAGGGSVQLAATVTGAQDTAVSWSVDEGSAGGSVDQAGLYLATLTAGTFHVRARPHADETRSAVAAITVSPAPGAPSIGSFAASPDSINAGQQATLSWSVSGADSLAIDNGVGPVTGASGSVVVTLAATTTFTLTATNALGAVTKTAKVTVLQKPQIDTFAVTPQAIVRGQGTGALSWSVSGAGNISIDNAIGAVGPTGSKPLAPNDTTTYTLTATNAVGTSTATATLTVTDKPVVSGFSPSASPIVLGQSSTLGWSVQGATSVTLDPGGIDVTGLSSKVVTPGATTLYTLTATNASGSTTATTTVAILDKPAIGLFAASPGTINVGQHSTLSFTVTGATSLSIDNNVGDVTGQASTSVAPASTTVYTMTATNAAGVSTATATVTVIQKPTLSLFHGTPATIYAAQSSLLSWTAGGADTLSIDNGVNSVTGLSSKSVAPAATTLYTLTATNTAGTTSASTTVTVLPKPVVGTFHASSPSLLVGQSSTLTWSVTGAVSIAIDQAVGDVTSLASKQVAPAATTQYTLTATNPAGTDSKSLTVTVAAVAVAASPKSLQLSEGQSRTFAAAVTGAIDTSVTWSVLEGSAGGSVTQQGVYTAPAAAAGTFHVVATSNADASKSDSATVTVNDPATYVTPGTVTGDVVVAIDSRASSTISNYIYGLNFAELGAARAATGAWGTFLPKYTLNRFGGNRLSGHNWENGYSNCGNDCSAPFNDNNLLYNVGATPGVGASISPRVDASFAASAGIVLTAPIIGYAAKGSSNGAGVPIPVAPDSNTPGTPDSTNWLPVVPHNPAGATATPSTSDGAVYTDDLAKWVDTTYPTGKSDPVKAIHYELDNEPDIWGGTHLEIRGKNGAAGAPNGGQVATGFDELVTKTLLHAQAIKSVTPASVVWAGGFAGFDGLTQLNFNAHPGGPPSGCASPGVQCTYYLDYFLKALKVAESNPTYGARMIDVLDFHWYTQDGNVTNDDGAQTAAVVNAREQAPRSLWDPKYIENTWVVGAVPVADETNCVGGNCPLYIVKRVQSRIAAYYPGTKVAIGEYWYGRGGDISGGIAVADVLGVFGKLGVYAATMWPNSSNVYSYYTPNNCSDYTCTTTHAYRCSLKAFDVYRNYDGAGAAFGDTSLQAVPADATFTDPATQNERATAYASMDAGKPGRVVVVAINKSLTTALNAGLALTHNVVFSKAQVYQVTGTNGGAGGCTDPVRQADITLPKTNAFNATLPAQSITIFVLLP